MVYIDDGVFIAPDQQQIQEAFRDLSNEFKDSSGKAYRAFKITDEGDLSNYLGGKIERLDNCVIKLSQPHLIQHIL
jgi:hypothetical protein